VRSRRRISLLHWVLSSIIVMIQSSMSVWSLDSAASRENSLKLLPRRRELQRQLRQRENHGKTAKGLSQFDFTPEALGLPPSIASCVVAIIIGVGFNFTEYEAVKAALSATGAFVFTFGLKRQLVKSSGGQIVSPDYHSEGMRSTMFDSFIILGGSHVASLMKQGRVVH
jgi:hypothetical protein